MTDDLFAAPVIDGKSLTRADIEPLVARRLPVHLIDCDLEQADLSKLDLTGWTFERCTIRRTDFSRSTLEATAWQGCRGAFADFVAADLTEARFASCDLNNALFRRATLRSAAIRGCKLTGADLTDAAAIDIRVDEVLFIGAKLPGWSFRKQSLKRIDFGQADLRKCDFRAATLDECSLRDAMLDGASFAGADLRNADLGGLRLTDASRFRGATISNEQAGQLLAELGLNVR
jgi:uncharacterized protein YjbI with pentapeptide repeats